MSACSVRTATAEGFKSEVRKVAEPDTRLIASVYGATCATSRSCPDQSQTVSPSRSEPRARDAGAWLSRGPLSDMQCHRFVLRDRRMDGGPDGADLLSSIHTTPSTPARDVAGHKAHGRSALCSTDAHETIYGLIRS